MSILQQARPASKPGRPVVASLVLTINGTSYDVEPVANAPGGARSFRLAKCSGDGATYDVDAFADRVECSYPSYRKTHEGTSSPCKHGRALAMVGLVDYPTARGAAPTPCDDHLAELVASAEAELVVRRKERAEHAAKVAELVAVRVAEGRPTPVVVPAFDPELYRCQDAVAERRALWLAHRHLHTVEPLPAPADREIGLVDDDGTPLETPAEMDRRHREEHEARVAALMTDNPFLPACCPADEPAPCSACATHEGPADLSDDGWDDAHAWTITGDVEHEPDWEVLELIEDGAELQAEGEGPLDFATPECFAAVAEGRAEAMRSGRGAATAPHVDPESRTLAEKVEERARVLRAEGSPLGDLLAELVDELAGEVRALDATTVEQFRDRRDGVLASPRGLSRPPRGRGDAPTPSGGF